MSSCEGMEKMNLSFAGCGFLCIYHAGVCAAIKEFAPELTWNKISGASAGAIAAAGLICNICMSEAMSIVLDVVCKARSSSLQAMSPMFNLVDCVRNGLERVLPENAHLICSGRLFISMTRARDYKNVVVSEFDTRAELIQAIICSSFIPFYCGNTPPMFRGEAYIDGAISDNQPIRDKYTISVSPFSGESDICPTDLDSASFLGFNFYGTSVQFTSQNLFRLVSCLFPPAPDICKQICRQGFEDVLRFLSVRGITPCVRCLKVKSLQSGVLPHASPKKSAKTIRKTTLMRPRTVPNSLNTLQNSFSFHRVDECTQCFEKVEIRNCANQFSDIPYPKIIQEALDKMDTDFRLFTYLRTFRAVRWILRFMAPVIYPIEFTIVTARKATNWIACFVQPDHYADRLQKLVDFLLAELESTSLLCDSSPRPSCQFSVDDGDTKSLQNEEKNEMTSELKCSLANVPCDSEVVSSRSSLKVSSSCGSDMPWNNYSSLSDDCLFNREENSADCCGEDSGLSLTEDSPQVVSVKKRDVGCSPIRHSGVLNRSAAAQRSATNSVHRLSMISSHSNNQYNTTSSSDNDDVTNKVRNGGSTASSRRHTISGSRRSLFSNKSTNSGSVGGSLANVPSALGKLDDRDSEGDDEEEDGRLFIPKRCQ